MSDIPSIANPLFPFSNEITYDDRGGYGESWHNKFYLQHFPLSCNSKTIDVVKGRKREDETYFRRGFDL